MIEPLALEDNCTSNIGVMHLNMLSVATLALGLRPKQGFARMRANRGARECGRV